MGQRFLKVTENTVNVKMTRVCVRVCTHARKHTCDLQRTYKAAKFNSQEEGPRLCELQHNQEAEHEALRAAVASTPAALSRQLQP